MKELSLTLERKMQDLPLLPAVVARLLALDSDHDDYFDEVLALAQEDPAFALRIIKLSNGAKDAPVEPIVSLREAVVRIGTRNIASLITSMAVINVFTPTTHSEKNLWLHAIQVAVTARVVACTTSAFTVNPEQAYLCGLLHDIGRFLLFLGAKEKLNKVEADQWSTPQEHIQLETKTFGFNHSQLGERICKKWGIPDVITNVVKYHHDYDLPQVIIADARAANLIRCVQLGDLFSVFMSVNPEAINDDEATLEDKLFKACIQVCTQSPIDENQLQTLSHSILMDSENIFNGLGLGEIK